MGFWEHFLLGWTASENIVRTCASCQLCCRLLPISAATRADSVRTGTMMILAGMLGPEARNAIPDFDKPAGKKCPHQRFGKGCGIYAKRPHGCRTWNCIWLGDEEATADLKRPDRSGYVIDVTPDYVTRPDDGAIIPVLQIWVDPKRRDAHRDPALRAFLKKQAIERGMYALIRWNAAEDCMFLAYDASTDQFFEKTSNLTGEKPHSALDKARALGPMTVEIKL